jgi:hypothetical protein
MLNQNRMQELVRNRITKCFNKHFEIEVNQYGEVYAMKGYCKAKDLRCS